MGEFLEFREVSKSFGSITAVDNVSLEVKRGEFFSLLGPSGCGKTTMLRLLAGFERPDSGRVTSTVDLVTSVASYTRVPSALPKCALGLEKPMWLHCTSTSVWVGSSL